MRVKPANLLPQASNESKTNVKMNFRSIWEKLTGKLFRPRMNFDELLERHRFVLIKLKLRCRMQHQRGMICNQPSPVSRSNPTVHLRWRPTLRNTSKI